jgi:hypothetical protein
VEEMGWFRHGSTTSFLVPAVLNPGKHKTGTMIFVRAEPLLKLPL